MIRAQYPVRIQLVLPARPSTPALYCRSCKQEIGLEVPDREQLRHTTSAWLESCGLLTTAPPEIWDPHWPKRA